MNITDLNKLISDFASQHLMINDYRFGDISDILTDNSIKYPLMITTPIATEITDYSIRRKFTFIFADIQMTDDFNILSGISQMEKIAVDFFTYIKTFEPNDFTVEDSNMDVFYEKEDISLLGYTMDLTLIFNYSPNPCDIAI